MVKDKSADERNRLTQQIMETERKLDDFEDLKRQYYRSLDHFYDHFQHLSNKYESLIEEGGRSQFQVDWEKARQLKHNINQYIEVCYAEFEETQTRFKRSTNEVLDRLITERSKLPWD